MNDVRRIGRRGIGGLADGIGFVFKGLGWVARHPRWWLFGLIPALVALVLYAFALVWLGTHATDVAAWLTPFADDWGWRDVFRVLVGIMIFIGGMALAVITFTAVTLAIGEPFSRSGTASSRCSMSCCSPFRCSS
jgi:CysZ protein